MSETYTVTSSADSGSESLREAVELANSNPGKDDIFVGVDVELSSLINITDSVDISGKYGVKITQTGQERIFTINDSRDGENINVSLSKLTLMGGRSKSIGGAILSMEDLTITDSQISENTSLYRGGGIYQVNGVINIERSQIDNNVAFNPDQPRISRGGGLYFLNSNYDITGSIFDDNESATGDGIYSFNSLGDIVNTDTNDDAILIAGLQMNEYQGEFFNRLELGISTPLEFSHFSPESILSLLDTITTISTDIDVTSTLDS